MRKVLTILLTAFWVLLSVTVSAIPADPTPKQIRQKDGTTITIVLYGDEYYHYTTTTDGYLITEVDGIYQYASVDSEGRISALGVNAKNPSLRTSVDNSVLAKASRGVPQQIFNKMQSQRRAENAVESRFTLDKMKNEGGLSRASAKQERVLVLLAQYTDVQFKTANVRQEFDDMMNQEGYSKNGATGSARDYYLDNSYGMYDPQMDVMGPYTLPHDMAYYGGNDDARVRDMIIDVCRAADSDVDFSEYASDGYITRLFVYYAGYNEAEGGPADSVWPHRWSVHSTPSFDGVKLYDYACSSELKGASGTRMASIGTFCHEYAHCLGLMDYYNTTYGTGTVNLGTLSLMNSGNYNNNSATPPELSAYDKSYLGWLELEPLPVTGSVEMKPLHELNGRGAYYINTSVDGEFFVFENRDMTYKWNKYINHNSPENGLLVYHVDRSNNYIAEAGTNAKQLWESNNLNSYAHECFKVVRAEKVSDVSLHLWFYPGRNNHTTLTSSNNTEFRAWSGDHTGYILENITAADKNITFDVFTADAELSVMVYDTKGSPVSGATVTLIDANIAKTMSNSIIAVGESTRALSGYYSYITNNNGKAVVETPTGDYRLIIGKAGVGTYSNDITVYPGATTRSFTIGNPNVGANITLYNYANNPTLAFNSGVDKSYLYGIQFDYDDIKVTEDGKRILASVMAPKNGTVKVAIKKNSEKAIVKDFSVDNSGVVNLTGEEVVLSKGDKVIVGVNNFSAWLDEDGNPDYGYNLISRDGETWQAQKYSGYGNIAWDISVGFADYRDSATSMSISNKTYNLGVGEVEQLAYNFSPAGSIGDPVWKSSDESVAVVDAGGIVRVVGAGQTIITATLDGKAATGSVTVNAVAEVEMSEPQLTNINGIWMANISWAPKQNRSNWVLYYKSNIDKTYTRKDFAGNVTNYTISNLIEGAEYEVHLSSKHNYLANEIWGTQSAQFVVEGELIEPESVEISGYKEVIGVDETLQLTAKTMPEGTYDREVIWSISPSNLASIDAHGLLTALNGGEVTVTATSVIKKVSGSIKLTIKNAVADIVVEPYQNDAIITWSGKHGSWKVDFKGNGVQKSATVDEPTFHIDCLKPNSSYTATITPIVDGQLVTDRAQTVQVKTTANMNSYASITAKGSYSTSDIIPLRVADIQGTLESVTWYIDGKQVAPPTAKLSAGRHKIEAVVKTMLNSEKLIKFVIVTQ
ncbi:MAG: M6 family metalloprotease domain-containing protein [Tidjanibacter sp.]|nr:M6 family metalloprotease domain-containing protein [Tidjanibacter sp.]